MDALQLLWGLTIAIAETTVLMMDRKRHTDIYHPDTRKRRPDLNSRFQLVGSDHIRWNGAEHPDHVRGIFRCRYPQLSNRDRTRASRIMASSSAL
ncbi:hypothetical protein GDO78_022936 [Eleutherodactylus coqui]|uniref:Secreted protein n=1 Tax=Eleutherodactylus coqui TaxID=57060 RepID=A0A8J6BGI9_ELECQ|nr:hypothetical protein GDO78_022936 [Eleutherodactylus coqui]